MRIIRTLALGAAAGVLLWTVARALAGPPARHGPDGRSVRVRGGVNGRTERVDDKADRKKGDRDATDEKQAKKPTDEGNRAADAAEPSNKGGKLRGLDRSDQVAGEHGKQRRRSARARKARQSPTD